MRQSHEILLIQTAFFSTCLLVNLLLNLPHGGMTKLCLHKPMLPLNSPPTSTYCKYMNRRASLPRTKLINCPLFLVARCSCLSPVRSAIPLLSVSSVGSTYIPVSHKITPLTKGMQTTATLSASGSPRPAYAYSAPSTVLVMTSFITTMCVLSCGSTPTPTTTVYKHTVPRHYVPIRPKASPSCLHPR